MVVLLVPCWPKLKSICLIFGQRLTRSSQVSNFLWRVRGFAVKIMTPMGCLAGLGVISPQGLVGGSCPCGCFKMLKWLSALIFVFNFWINI